MPRLPRDFIGPRRPRGRPISTAPEKKLADAKQRQQAFRIRRALDIKCIRYATSKVIDCRNRFSTSAQVEIWEAFMLYIGGSGDNWIIRLTLEDGAPSIASDFDGLKESIKKDLMIYEIEIG